MTNTLGEPDLAFGMHSSISSPTALHAQSLSTLLPYLAQHFLQDALDGGHCFLGALLQLKPPAPVYLVTLCVQS